MSDETPVPAKKPKLTISIPLSVEGSALLKSKMAVYAGQVTQANFLALVSDELGVEKNLSGALARVVTDLEAERQVKLGLMPRSIGEASWRTAESAPAAPSGPALEAERQAKLDLPPRPIGVASFIAESAPSGRTVEFLETAENEDRFGPRS